MLNEGRDGGAARRVNVHRVVTDATDDVFELSEIARQRLIDGGVAPLRISVEVHHDELSSRVLRVDGRAVWEASIRVGHPDRGIEERWLLVGTPGAPLP